MTASVANVIRAHCDPRQPNPTGVEARLQTLSPVRAVLFDVYGTLLISASGDIGSQQEDARASAMETICQQFAIEEPATRLLERLDEAIAESHAASRDRGIEHPEIEIVSVWNTALGAEQNLDANTLQQVALVFELLTNPVWPMPSAETTLKALRDDGLTIGIVSNAQFYTLAMIETLIGNPSQLGISRDLSFYSFEHGRAKPGLYLYEQARAALDERGFAPEETLMVGNDMLNDIAAAHRVGFRTALFAGDNRSLRERADDPRVTGIEPDIIIDDLQQLTRCLG